MERMCYIARRAGCPGAAAICMDLPEDAVHVDRWIRRYTRDGLAVERVSVADGVEALRAYDAYRRSAEAAQGWLAL